MDTPDAEVIVNAADDIERRSIYLTVSGTSAEAGDDGEAGRGNRVNGLITPFRPMTMESVAGKNPANHTGKIYNIAASLIAERVVETLPAVNEAECILVSEIGRRVDEPQLMQLRLRPGGTLTHDIKLAAEDIARAELSSLHTLPQDLLTGVVELNRWPLGSGDR
jgi:S-adenosylmethionine synthetase